MLSSLGRARRLAWVLGSAAFITFIILAVGHSCARAPWWDEGLFADVAITFRNHGHLGSSALSPYGYLPFPRVNQFTYWQFPMYLIGLGSWLRFVPVTMVWVRIFSVVWGCVYIVCWFLIVRCLSGKESLALLVSSVVALNYATVAAASDGRMDMMCASLGYAGIASYLCLRRSNWTRAVFTAACFGAASLFCHPMGGLMNLSIAAVALLDWRRISLKALAAACLPYILGAALYLLYVLQEPEIFLAQTRAASGYRMVGWWGLVQNVLNDGYVRYYHYYFRFLYGIDKLKAAALVFAVVGTLGLVFNRKLITEPLGRTLLILACIGYFGVAAMDNQKLPVYFIYSLPVMSACGAVWVYDCWQRGGLVRVLTSVLLAGSILSTIGGFAYKIYLNGYDHVYQPAVVTIRRFLPPGGLVMGGSELGFAFGFGPQLVDDRYLGYFSGKRPDVFVENGYYGRIGGPIFGPARLYADTALQKEYHLEFVNAEYRIYVRNDRTKLAQAVK
jgi:hypothetical protein